MSAQSVLEFPVELSLPCIRISQPIGSFFICSIDSKSLCEITFADVRRMYQEREVETYLGVQRPLNKVRVSEIAEYVQTTDACFPTSVILAVDGKCVEYDEANSRLLLKNYASEAGEDESISRIQIAKVLDGQHRIEGLRNYVGPTFEVNVSIFVDMDIESQAYVFSTVNLAQTKVNKSLVYDLFEYARSRSPQKTCHNIAVALDRLPEGPFYRRIKRLGSATQGRFTETLTQATFVEALLPYLTKNKVVDRDLYKRGKRPALAGADELRTLIFRNMFIEERDLEIADVVLNYFSAVSRRWPEAWNFGGQGLILNKTNGFRALMKLLRPLYLKFARPGEVPTVEQFADALVRVQLADQDFNVDRYKPGTSGQASLYSDLARGVGV